MRAAFVAQHGAIDQVVQVGERPEPVARGDRIVLDVRAATVNPRDWLLVEGRYVFRALAGRLPLVLGSDAAGVVTAVGPKVRRFAVGDEVLTMQTPLGRFGAFAERMAVREGAVATKPADLSFEHAAGIGVAGLTALQALRDDARLAPGERVLVVGASGGVGSFAVQVARVLGAQVTGVCSGRNADLVRDLGAEEVIDYTEVDFRDSATGYDVVFDTIGREHLGSVRRCLNDGGRYVSTVPNARNSRDQLVGTTLGRLRRGARRSRTVVCKALGSDLGELAEHAASSRLRVVIDSTFLLSQTADALTRSRTKRARGKIVVRVAD